MTKRLLAVSLVRTGHRSAPTSEHGVYLLPILPDCLGPYHVDLLGRAVADSYCRESKDWPRIKAEVEIKVRMPQLDLPAKRSPAELRTIRIRVRTHGWVGCRALGKLVGGLKAAVECSLECQERIPWRTFWLTAAEQLREPASVEGGGLTAALFEDGRRWSGCEEYGDDALDGVAHHHDELGVSLDGHGVHVPVCEHALRDFALVCHLPRRGRAHAVVVALGPPRVAAATQVL
mmetsp:Transcript_19635/g.58196  ORF Transcript_19635/g.58196 Transcript_19635/m.58196 type:complete len:233 (-) Transcript_19635:224-922(-)